MLDTHGDMMQREKTTNANGKAYSVICNFKSITKYLYELMLGYEQMRANISNSDSMYMNF